VEPRNAEVYRNLNALRGLRMPPLLLKSIRFFVPAVMLYFVIFAFCWFSHWCELAFPTQYDEITKSVAAIILGFVYSVSNLRELANGDYYNAVNQNLMDKLIGSFAADPNVPRDMPWAKIRPIFYRFVDNDASLKHQTTLAYWNGALWTSSADLRAISCLASVMTGIMMLLANIVGDIKFDNVRATYFFLFAVLTFLISIWFSRLTTQRHINIGTEQCEFILVQYRQKLKDKLIEASR
jgi:hypothetical protein